MALSGERRLQGEAPLGEGLRVEIAGHHVGVGDVSRKEPPRP